MCSATAAQDHSSPDFHETTSHSASNNNDSASPRRFKPTLLFSVPVIAADRSRLAQRNGNRQDRGLKADYLYDKASAMCVRLKVEVLTYQQLLPLFRLGAKPPCIKTVVRHLAALEESGRIRRIRVRVPGHKQKVGAVRFFRLDIAISKDGERGTMAQWQEKQRQRNVNKTRAYRVRQKEAKTKAKAWAEQEAKKQAQEVDNKDQALPKPGQICPPCDLESAPGLTPGADLKASKKALPLTQYVDPTGVDLPEKPSAPQADAREPQVEAASAASRPPGGTHLGPQKSEPLPQKDPLVIQRHAEPQGIRCASNITQEMCEEQAQAPVGAVNVLPEREMGSEGQTIKQWVISLRPPGLQPDNDDQETKGKGAAKDSRSTQPPCSKPRSPSKPKPKLLTVSYRYVQEINLRHNLRLQWRLFSEARICTEDFIDACAQVLIYKGTPVAKGNKVEGTIMKVAQARHRQRLGKTGKGECHGRD